MEGFGCVDVSAIFKASMDCAATAATFLRLPTSAAVGVEGESVAIITGGETVIFRLVRKPLIRRTIFSPALDLVAAREVATNSRCAAVIIEEMAARETSDGGAGGEDDEPLSVVAVGGAGVMAGIAFIEIEEKYYALATTCTSELWGS